MTVMELGTPPVEAPAERPRKLPLKETGRVESVDRRLSTVGASALPPGNVNGAPQVSGAVSGKGTAAFHVHGALLLPVIGIQAQGAPVVGRRVAGKGGTRRYLHVPAAVERAAAAALRPVAGKGNGGLLDYGTCVNRSALGEAAHRVIFIGGGARKK